MNRRDLIRYIASSSAACLMGAGAVLFVSKKPYVIRDYYRSLREPEARFSTTQEFWESHYDRLGDSTNRSFLRAGRLLSKRSFLLEDQKTVVVEQVFRSKSDYIFRESIKAFLPKQAQNNDAVVHIKQVQG